ncbi:MAG: hypothetical protein AB8B91_21560 [Rubripirellula sp.]
MGSADFDKLDDETFDVVFATDLVYQADCWKLCGDGHCCHFSRYKKNSSEQDYQSLPLLAGEYEYMKRRGYLQQYSEMELQRTSIDVEDGEWNIDMLRVRVDASCPCDHNLRPTVCRIYPLWPIFSAQQGLVGISTSPSQFEVMEKLGGLESACKVSGTSFAEFQKFLAICTAISANPRVMFSVMMMGLCRDLFEEKLHTTMQTHKVNMFQAMAMQVKENAFVDEAECSRQTSAMVSEFKTKFGSRFSLTPSS